MKPIVSVALLFAFISFSPAFAARSKVKPGAVASGSEPKVRYKSGKEINFGATTVNGGIQRPDISVVTGNESEGDNGLLRLRENFMDRIASDFAEEVQ